MNKVMSVIVSVGIVGVLSACANTGNSFTPIVDKQGVNEAKFQNDLAQCQELSTQTTGAAKTAGIGALGGAAIGAAIGGISGGSSSAGIGAGIGAVTGLVGGGAKGNAETENVIRRCLAGRGYKVLN